MFVVSLLSAVVALGVAPAAPDFDSQIIPVLTKSGCNSGACHGAAAGRGGLHLSLLGADPAADYDALVHALEGRRVNLARPALSLVLTKPTGELDHGGGTVLDDRGRALLAAWIADGAPRGPGRRLTNLEVTPRRATLQNIPAAVDLRVVARFDQLPAENVTAWTVLTSADPAAVAVDSQGVAHVKRRGQHIVVARFLNRVVPIQLNAVFSDTASDLSRQPQANFIDEHILRMLSELHLPIAPPASDAEFLRRVTLDLTGRLPEPEAIARYSNDVTPDRRCRLVDELLNSEAFVDYWTLRIARQLRVHSLPGEPQATRAYVDWIRDQVRGDVGVDRMARELIMATGDSHLVGPANFGRMVGDARGQAELIGQAFLGVRLGCANCHNHPLDRWTQDDYHGLAAVFARLERGRQVRLASTGEVTNPRTKEPAVGRIPGVRDLDSDGDPRAALAEWLAADDNGQFARASVNRLWRAMFGRGLVEPVDDLRETNPATHPELLEQLAADFAAHGHRIRHTLRLIATSETYARGGRTLADHRGDDRFYSHVMSKPLPAEVLADAIADVTGVADRYADQPAGTRAVALVDPLIPALSLDVLGRCSRGAGCDELEAADGGLPRQLHLLNGPLINAKIAAAEGRLQRLVAAGRTVDQVVGEFYLRALARQPTDNEVRRWSTRLDSDDAGERLQRLEDFVWGLLNSRAFSENH